MGRAILRAITGKSQHKMMREADTYDGRLESRVNHGKPASVSAAAGSSRARVEDYQVFWDLTGSCGLMRPCRLIVTRRMGGGDGDGVVLLADACFSFRFLLGGVRPFGNRS